MFGQVQSIFSIFNQLSFKLLQYCGILFVNAAEGFSSKNFFFFCNSLPITQEIINQFLYVIDQGRIYGVVIRALAPIRFLHLFLILNFFIENSPIDRFFVDTL